MTADGETVTGVCIDLDDTLFPQEQWLAGAWTDVAHRATELGLDGTALHAALVRIAAHGSDKGGIIDAALLAIGASRAGCVAPLVSAFAAHAPRHLTSYPGALESLERLHAVAPVVLVTDGNPRIQRAKITALGVAHLVDHLVISDELGGRALRKPHAAPFVRALSLLGLSADRVVHVGDRPGKDVAGARGVGMRCIRVRTGEYAGLADPVDETPWRSAGSFADAVDLLLPLVEAGARTMLRHAGLQREQPGVAARL